MNLQVRITYRCLHLVQNYVHFVLASQPTTKKRENTARIQGREPHWTGPAIGTTFSCDGNQPRLIEKLSKINTHPQDTGAVARAFQETFQQVAPEKPEHELTTLVLLSGGIDSVAVLANMLMRTEHRVHAHHVELANRDNRVRAENDAVADVIDYCWNNFRDFEYSSSVNEFRVTPKGYDLIVALVHGAMVCLASKRRPDYLMTGHFNTTRGRAVYGTRMLSNCFTNPKNAPLWLRPLDALTDRAHAKVDIYRSVPPDLAALSWSCRTPVISKHGGFAPCGKCYACKALNTARERAAAKES